MTVTIELKPETKKRLAERAKQNGLPIETYIEVFIEDTLEETKDKSKIKSFPQKIGKEEWQTEFRKWLNSRKDRGEPFLSDEATRRENIYEDRF